MLSAAADTVSFALTEPPAGTVKSPSEGVTVTPAGAVAVQCTEVDSDFRLCTLTVVSELPEPGSVFTCSGAAPVKYFTPPPGKDGGASPAALPQEVSAVAPSV